MQSIFSSNTNAKYKEAKADFDKINSKKGTHTELKDKPDCLESHILAEYNPINGLTSLSYKAINDPYYRLKLNKIMKHELVHAAQAETVARSKDGVRKLNYATFMRIVRSMQKAPYKKIYEIINAEIQNDKTGKYDNVEYNLVGVGVNLKAFMSSACRVFNGEELDMDSVPTVIDTEHYNRIVKEKGPLKPKE